jgi:hypothetical protein
MDDDAGMSSSLQLPDDDSLRRYLALLQRALILARVRAYETDPQLADLLDAIHNVPTYLVRWPEMKEFLVADALEDLGKKYPEWRGLLSILQDGARPGWPLPRVDE